MEDRLEQVIGCLAGSGVGSGIGLGWPHAPQRQHAEESPVARPAAPADGGDTVQQLQSRLEEMERRLRREEAADDDRYDVVRTGALRHAAGAERGEGLHAGHRREQRLPQDAGPSDAWRLRRGQTPPETLLVGNSSRPVVPTRTHAPKADARDRGRDRSGHAAQQHDERRAHAEAETGSGGHVGDARASVEERDALRWQA